MARSKDPFKAERARLHVQDLINAKKNPNDLFPDRPSWNPIRNAFSDVKDFGSGLSTLVSSLPSFIKGDVQAPTLPQLAKAIAKGYIQSYGQQKGLNPKAALQSFVKHPLNVVDILPGLDLLSGGKLASKVAKAGKLGKAFDKMGEIERAKGPFTITKGEIPKSKILQGQISKDIKLPAGRALDDNVATSFARRSTRGFTPEQMNIWGHIYGSMLNNLDKAKQAEILNAAKVKLGIESTKDLKPNQMWNLVEAVRNELPTKPTTLNKNGKNLSEILGDKGKLVTGQRLPEYKPKTIPAMRGLKQSFSGSVLTNPRWVIGNALSDLAFAGANGKNPIDLYIRGAKGVTKDLVSPSDLGGFYRKSTEVLKDAPHKTKLQKFDTALNDLFFGLEGRREQAFRRGLFDKNMETLAKESLKSKGAQISKEALSNEVTRLSKLSPFYDKAIKQTRQTLGDYRDFDSLKSLPIVGNKLPEWAKTYTGEILANPFIKWHREVAKIIPHNAINNPYIFTGQRGLSKLGNQFQQQQQDYLNSMGYQIPDYAKGGFVSGFNEQGVPQIYTAGDWLPQATLGKDINVLSKFPSTETETLMNPGVTIPMQVVNGTSWTGRPATAPNVFSDFKGRYYQDPITDQKSYLQGNQLPNGEGLLYGISQGLRDFTKLGTLEKLLPYKTYDTRIGIPDINKQPKKQNYILNNLGFGNTYDAYPLPTYLKYDDYYGN